MKRLDLDDDLKNFLIGLDDLHLRVVAASIWDSEGLHFQFWEISPECADTCGLIFDDVRLVWVVDPKKDSPILPERFLNPNAILNLRDKARQLLVVRSEPFRKLITVLASPEQREPQNWF